MHYIDIVIIIPLLWGVYKGFTKGFVISVSTFLALFVGVYVAANFSGFTSEFLIDNFHIDNEYLSIISFAVTFIIVVVLIHLLARILDGVIKSVALGLVNKLFGALFGIARALLIISIVIFLINKFDENSNIISEELKSESILYEPINSFISSVYPILDDVNISSISQKVNDVTEDLKSKIDSIP